MNLNVLTTSVEQEESLAEILEERKYQDTLWGPAFERTQMTEEKWTGVMDDLIHGKGRYQGRDFIIRMKKAAAVGLAILEWRKRNPV